MEVFGVVLLVVAMAAADLPSLVRQRWWPELAAYLAVLGLAVVAVALALSGVI